MYNVTTCSVVAEYNVRHAGCMLFIQGGTTPLMLAALNGHLEIVDLLLSSQAEVNQTRVSDFTICTPTKKHEFQEECRVKIIFYRVFG